MLPRPFMKNLGAEVSLSPTVPGSREPTAFATFARDATKKGRTHNTPGPTLRAATQFAVPGATPESVSTPQRLASGQMPANFRRQRRASAAV